MTARGLELVEGGGRGWKGGVVSELSGGSPKRYVQTLIPGACVTFFWKKGLCRHNKVKDEMRSFWITWLCPKSNEKYPYKRQKEKRYAEEKAI